MKMSRKQALALTFAKALAAERPQIRRVTLAETLKAVNRAQLAKEYKRM